VDLPEGPTDLDVLEVDPPTVSEEEVKDAAGKDMLHPKATRVNQWQNHSVVMMVTVMNVMNLMTA